MKELTEAAIRASFINCSKGEAKRLTVPRGLPEAPWPDLDFIGWNDPAAPGRAYLVTVRAEDPVGVALKYPANQSGLRHRRMCSLCLTNHNGSGVSLMTARKAGAAGRDGNTIGLYMCTDLACSQYVRGTKKPDGGNRLPESLSVDEQIERLQGKLFGFLDQLAA